MSNRLRRPASPRAVPEKVAGKPAALSSGAKAEGPLPAAPKLSWILGIFGTLFLLALLLAGLSAWVMLRRLHHT